MADHLSNDEPVIDAAAIAAKVTATITAVGALATVFGYTTDTEVSAFAEAAGTAVLALGGLVGAVLPIVTAFRARAKVTPVAHPRSADGMPLVPLGSRELR